MLVGNRTLMAAEQVDLADLDAVASDAARDGRTPMFVAVDGAAAALIVVADEVKPESAEAVAQLEALGLQVWMLTGDNAATAAAVAREVGIEHVLAEVLPGEKAAEGPRVQVVDGVRVVLGGDVHAGETSDLRFSFTEAATGRPLDDLRPYLAAAGHIVSMRADGSAFAHGHAEVETPEGDPVFAVPGQTFGPDLAFHARFEVPGTYRLWGQFRLADGRVLTAPFTVTTS